MVNVYEYRDSKWGKAFGRISNALHQYSPEWVRWVDNPLDSDLYFIHIVGGGEAQIIDQAIQNNKKFVVMQHTYFTSGYGAWDKYWEKAVLAISFHNLRSYTNLPFNFLHTPLGADSKIFHPLNLNRDKRVFTTGHVAETENIDKLYHASFIIGQTMYHTGENFKYGNYYQFLPYMDDNLLCRMLNTTEYVSCLREHEGFEMMGIEGLFCGARPIVPNLDTYSWYKDHAIFVDMNGAIVPSLVEILKSKPEPVLEDELNELKKIFEWSNIVQNIFNNIKLYI